MSLRGNKGVGIPTVLMHEGEGLVVTVETRSGAVYRGTVDSVEDSMNVGLRGVTATAPDGATATLERVFIRGSTVLLVIFPDVLKMAPMFDRLRKAAAGLSTAGGLGRGRQLAIEAKGACGRAAQSRRRRRASRREGCARLSRFRFHAPLCFARRRRPLPHPPPPPPSAAAKAARTVASAGRGAGAPAGAVGGGGGGGGLMPPPPMMMMGGPPMGMGMGGGGGGFYPPPAGQFGQAPPPGWGPPR